MEEYIKKSDLIEEFTKRHQAWEDAADSTILRDLVCEYQGRAGAYKNACTIIEKIPTADVRENIHGEWIDYDDDYGSLACSICEKDAPGDIPWDFCPYCGADMRGETK